MDDFVSLPKDVKGCYWWMVISVAAFLALVLAAVSVSDFNDIWDETINATRW